MRFSMYIAIVRPSNCGSGGPTSSRSALDHWDSIIGSSGAKVPAATCSGRPAL